MTFPRSEFDDVVGVMKRPGMAFDAAFNEVRARAHRSDEALEISVFGERAWAEITPMERALALPGLFRAYYWQVYNEETERQRKDDTAAGRTYLEPDDLVTLSESLFYQERDGETDTVTTIASSLSNVLAELALLQHQLAEARTELAALKVDPGTTS